MMKHTLTFFALLLVTPFSRGETLCSPKLLTSPDFYTSAIKVCQTESKHYGYNFLNRWIEEKHSHCQLFYPNSSSDEHRECLSNILNFSNDVLTCQSSLHRHQEAVQYDSELLAQLIQGNGGLATIPEIIQKRFDHLVKSTEQSYSFKFSPKWSLKSYQGKVANAHAGAGGEIVVSAALWNGETPFSVDEITAILAHEIAHVLKDHSLRLGCSAMEWVGSEFSISEISKVFREDFSTATERGRAWTEKSQSYEFEADKVATRILKKAGINPRAMAMALEKLKPKTDSNFTTGSHPTFDLRIQQALEGI